MGACLQLCIAGADGEVADGRGPMQALRRRATSEFRSPAQCRPFFEFHLLNQQSCTRRAEFLVRILNEFLLNCPFEICLLS